MKRNLTILLLCLVPLFLSAQENTAEVSISSEEKIYDFPDDYPKYPGGDNALQAFIKENLVYPEKAKEAELQGKVFLEFIIDKEGAITTIENVYSPSPLLSAAAEDLIKKMPNWLPGKVAGEPVAVRMRLPIAFFLDQD